MSRIDSRVVVCRGCCCGTEGKHPDVDHEAQLRTLRAGLGEPSVRVISCFDRCEKSNVMVVLPSREGRRAGGRPTWFGFMLASRPVADLTAWIRAGGPGVAPVPESLAPQRITPPDKGRKGSGGGVAPAPAKP